MFLDNNLVVSGGVSAAGVITYQTPATTGTTLSTNVIDLGTNRDFGEGGDVYIRAQVGAAYTGLTSLEIQAITADDAALTVNVNIIGSTGPILLAALTAGSRVAANINPRIGSKGQRYLGARFSVVGTSTAGTSFVDFGKEIQDGQKFYPSGFTIA